MVIAAVLNRGGEHNLKGVEELKVRTTGEN
jgi:hypothetical protein